MRRRLEMIGKRWIVRPGLNLVLVLAVSGPILAQASGDGRDSAGAPPEHRLPLQHRGLEERVRSLTQALDLDATQQSALRKLLEGQREQIGRAWSNESVPAIYRVSATQAISDKTADQIRSLLNEEQKKKYNPPRQARDALAGSARSDVAAWMNAGQAQAGLHRSPEPVDESLPR